jgi:hypothetical protein
VSRQNPLCSLHALGTAVVRPCKARPCPRPRLHSFIRPQQKDGPAGPSPSPFPSGHVRDPGVCRVLLNTEQPLLHADRTTTTAAVSFLFTATGHSETPSWTSLAVCYLKTPPRSCVVLSARGQFYPAASSTLPSPPARCIPLFPGRRPTRQLHLHSLHRRRRTRAEQRTAATSLLAASLSGRAAASKAALQPGVAAACPKRPIRTQQRHRRAPG